MTTIDLSSPRGWIRHELFHGLIRLLQVPACQYHPRTWKKPHPYKNLSTPSRFLHLRYKKNIPNNVGKNGDLVRKVFPAKYGTVIVGIPIQQSYNIRHNDNFPRKPNYARYVHLISLVRDRPDLRRITGCAELIINHREIRVESWRLAQLFTRDV